MTLDAARIDRPVDDPVSDVLKWVLLVVAIGTFALLAWATTVTYQTAPPQPDRFVAANGTVLMTGDDIAAGKGGFQKADLMDYGSLYGMGSYYGEDYTFRWTWISFCFTFFAFGVVLFIYEFFLNNPDDAPMDPVLSTFHLLTPSQKRIGKYFFEVNGGQTIAARRPS
jgi:nitric oxide reductase large subunit